MDEGVALAAEHRARVLIDAQLAAAGWSVQNRKAMNLFAAQGVAVREVRMTAGHGRADYLLYVDQRAVGVIEAKPVGGIGDRGATNAPPAALHPSDSPKVFERTGRPAPALRRLVHVAVCVHRPPRRRT